MLSCLSSFHIGLLLVAVTRCSSSSYSTSSLTLTDDYYSKVKIDIGTPSQTFSVFVDTTNIVTWVFDDSADLDDDQSFFDSSASSTWSSDSTTFSYTYFNGSTNGTMGTDTLVVSSLNLTNQEIGLADYNDAFFEDEEVSGSLSLCRTSYVMQNLAASEDAEAEVTLDIASKKLHVGKYSGSYKNSTEVDAITDNTDIEDYWSFSFDSMSTNAVSSLLSCDDDCYGIIDSASPYLSFGMTESKFEGLWENIAGSSDNCDISTLKCDSESDIAYYIKITIGNDTFYMERSDYYYDKKLHILRVDQIGDIIGVYFGRPLLKTMDVSLNAINETITFSYDSSSSTGKWTTVWITAVCVAVFALIFFGIFFWKFKIPPATHGTHEEQVETRSLLHGQPAHAQPHQPLGAAPATQANVTAPVQAPPQAVGSATGASQTTDPDEIRRRRLQFLESQQQQEDEQ